MALDPGTARCGVAISDPLGVIATPMDPLPVRDGARLAEEIAAIAREAGACRILVGYPLNMDGTEGQRARACARLAERIRAVLPDIPVELVDERLTTVEAQARLLEAGHSPEKRRRLKDSAAAAVMLQWWLESRHT